MSWNTVCLWWIFFGLDKIKYVEYCCELSLVYMLWLFWVTIVIIELILLLCHKIAYSINKGNPSWIKLQIIITLNYLTYVGSVKSSVLYAPSSKILVIVNTIIGVKITRQQMLEMHPV